MPRGFSAGPRDRRAKRGGKPPEQGIPRKTFETMYDYINGKIAELLPAAVIIDNGGIGYFINISLQTYSAIEGREEVRIYVQQYMVRDELPVMYGFATQAEREIFRMLVNVSGVGGNTARMILSTFSVAELRDIISSGNSVSLKRVKGLGMKTSEKIIVELRDKILNVETDGTASIGERTAASAVDHEIYEEALTALTMLGFARTASDKAVKHILADHPDAKVEEVIRYALKNL